jgi:RNA polymerase sigma factor for flagellar operon FliA
MAETPIGALREMFEERADRHGWDPDDLVTGHLWLVDRLAANAARRYPSHVDRRDLWAAGVLGLVEASRRYDPSTGVPFASFASARVRGEIIDQARSRDMASRRLRQVLRLVVRASDFLAQHLGRTATLEEIAEATGIPYDTVRTALDELAAITDVQSIDEPSTSSDSALVDNSAEPADVLTEAELLGTVRDAVERLPEPLRTIVLRSYWDGARLQDIAADMNITFQRVAQYRNEALVALNAWFSHLYDELDDPDEEAPGKARRAAFCATMATRSSWRSRLEAASVLLRVEETQRHLHAVPDEPAGSDATPAGDPSGPDDPT